MIKHPKISIITPVMNGEKFLERCIKSIANQNYPINKIEHIIIDGGSTDGSVSIIKKNKKQIRYWHSKKYDKEFSKKNYIKFKDGLKKLIKWNKEWQK